MTLHTGRRGSLLTAENPLHRCRARWMIQDRETVDCEPSLRHIPEIRGPGKKTRSSSASPSQIHGGDFFRGGDKLSRRADPRVGGDEPTLGAGGEVEVGWTEISLVLPAV